MATLLLVPSSVHAQKGPGTRLDGSATGASGAGGHTSLAEAIERLAAEAEVEVLFTDEIVRPWARVTRVPTGATALERLKALLSIHGLELREGPDGVLLIAVGETGLQGAVVGGTLKLPPELEGGATQLVLRPLGSGDVRGSVDHLEGEMTGPRSFAFPAATPGRWILSVRHPGAVPLEQELLLTSGAPVDLELELVTVPHTMDEIEVSATHHALTGSGPVDFTLDESVAASVAQAGNDLLHRVTLLPGTVGDSYSARFGVRGGRPDEVAIRLDGMEIVDPYHLGDFQSPVSSIDSHLVATTELRAGGWSADTGDRRGAVLDLTSLEPTGERRNQLDLGTIDVAGLTARRSREGRFGLLASARWGFPDLVLDLAEEQRNPRFWDGYLKLDADGAEGRSGRAHALLSGDTVDYVIDEDEETRERVRSRWENHSFWGTGQWVRDAGLLLEVRAGYSHLERNRELVDAAEDAMRSLRDVRGTNRSLLEIEGAARMAGHELRWGAESRRTRTMYDVATTTNLENPLALVRQPPRPDSFSFADTIRSDLLSGWVSDRWTTDVWTVEAGLRWDDRSRPDGQHLSPRLSATVALGPQTSLSGAWGHYWQSQRPYELAVEDAETTLFPAERAEHRNLGFQHRMDRFGLSVVRFELWDRRIRDPRPRWENLFDPLAPIPELAADRVRAAPDAGRARGFEIFVGGDLGTRVEWFASWTESRSEERYGATWRPAFRDQAHAAVVDLDIQVTAAWRLNLAGRWHSGWPTTALDVAVTAPTSEEGEPTLQPVLGPLRAERLPSVARLDLRIQRSWDLRRGTLRFAFDIQNVTNRENLRGWQIELRTEDGEPVIDRTPKTWPGLLPSFNLGWSF